MSTISFAYVAVVNFLCCHFFAKSTYITTQSCCIYIVICIYIYKLNVCCFGIILQKVYFNFCYQVQVPTNKYANTNVFNFLVTLINPNSVLAIVYNYIDVILTCVYFFHIHIYYKFLHVTCSKTFVKKLPESERVPR